MIWYMLAAIVLVAADQAVKLYASLKIGVSGTITVIPHVLDFVYIENTGAAFSMLSGMTWLLGLISAAFCVAVIVYWMKKRPQNRLLCIALTLMFAGALGNAIDRIFRGYVIDFIRAAFVNFPICNIADIAITVGAVLLILYVIFSDLEKKKQCGK